MQEYREQARQRFLQSVQEREEQLEQEKRESEKQARIEDDHSYVYKQLEEWDRIAESKQEEDIRLPLLCSMIDHESRFMKLLTQYDRMDELRERIVCLVHCLNEQCEQSKKSLSEIRDIHSIMKEMIEQTGVDITIEMMDTHGDEELTRRLQEEENGFLEEYEEKIDLPSSSLPSLLSSSSSSSLPKVYLSSRGGLLLLEMKKLAKSNGIKFSGLDKEHLAKLLEDRGLVEIVP